MREGMASIVIIQVLGFKTWREVTMVLLGRGKELILMKMVTMVAVQGDTSGG